MLLKSGFEEFAARGIARAKVAVAAANHSAIRFYLHCGFRLAATRLHHGQAMNIYDIDLVGADPPVPSAPAVDSAPRPWKPLRFSPLRPAPAAISAE